MKQAGDTEAMAAALGNLGIIARDQGDADAAETHLEQSLALWRQLGRPGRDRLGTDRPRHGRPGARQARRGVGAHRREPGDLGELGDRQNTANVLSTAARLARDQGEYAVARARLAESLQIFRDLGDRRGIAFVFEGLAGLAADEAQPLRAQSLAASAAALRRIIGAGPPPAWQADLERSLEAASRGVGRAALEEARGRGHSMTLPEAIAFALEEPGRPGADGP